MSWKINLVLLFAKLRKPMDVNKNINLLKLRKESDKAARLGTVLFDSKIPVAGVTDTNANGVPVRIYNNSSTTNQPVIIYYHGGGFVLYGIYSHDYVCRRLCAMNNCIVVSVDYRLAPEHTYPAAHDDAYTALQWIRQNIGNYGGNANSLIVAGDSAGGNLAACMAHRCKAEGIALKAQILIYPWIDGKLSNPSIDRNGKGFLLEKPTLFWFQKQYTPRKEDQCAPALSPCYQTDFTGLAPAFILTAQLDPLLDDGHLYYQQLKAAGNMVEYTEYPKLFHGFFNLPHVHRNAMQAYTDIKNFIARLPS